MSRTRTEIHDNDTFRELMGMPLDSPSPYTYEELADMFGQTNRFAMLDRATTIEVFKAVEEDGFNPYFFALYESTEGYNVV